MKVAVVGAGLAGLLCARRLRELALSDQTGSGQIEIDIFDKGRFVGGRLASRFTSSAVSGGESCSKDNGEHFDYGAQYFTIRDRRLSDYLSQWTEAGVVLEWQGRIVDLLPVDADRCAVPRGGDKRYVGVPAMRSLAEYLSKDLNVNCAIRIASLEQLQAARYDLVILNLPPVQCQPFLNYGGGHSELKVAVERARMRPCFALMVSFPEALPIDFDGAFVHDSKISWLARDSSKPGRLPGERFVIHASPDYAQEVLEEPLPVVANALKEEFSRVLGFTIPAPSFEKIHRWRYSIASETLNCGSLFSQSERLAICGDWLTESRVEGALLSGLDCAEKSYAFLRTMAIA